MIQVFIACAVVAFAGCKNASESKAGDPVGQPAGQRLAETGKSLDNFDPCSVVDNNELSQALLAGAGDPSAMGKIAVTHAAGDGAATGLPGAKACKLTWQTTDSAG